MNLRLRSDQDTSIGLRLTDETARQYRALIFVNGWNMGQYINNLGPQHLFPIPNGILNTHGDNTIAIASWAADDTSGGLGTVTLEDLGTVAGGVPVQQVAAPPYDAPVDSGTERAVARRPPADGQPTPPPTANLLDPPAGGYRPAARALNSYPTDIEAWREPPVADLPGRGITRK